MRNPSLFSERSTTLFNTESYITQQNVVNVSIPNDKTICIDLYVMGQIEYTHRVEISLLRRKNNEKLHFLLYKHTGKQFYVCLCEDKFRCYSIVYL